MKPLLCVLTTALLFSTQNAISQEYVKNSGEEPRYNSEFLVVNYNTGLFSNEMSFGPYKIILLRKGLWSGFGQGLFRSKYISKTSQHSSFLIVANDIDSVLVQMLTTRKEEVKKTHSIEYSNGKWSRPTQKDVQLVSNEITADITILPDSIKWKLTGIENAINTDTSYFVLSNNQLKIPTKHIDDAINSRWQHAYEFSLNEKPIGAVKTFSGPLAWVDNNLDGKIKLGVAAAIASMLLISPPLSNNW